MATAFGLEPTPGVPSIPTIRDHVPDALHDSGMTDSSLRSSPAHSPPPNPVFSFPAQPMPSQSAPSTFPRTSGRRPMSAIETVNHSYQLSTDKIDRPKRGATLPDFSFNPGASLSQDNKETIPSPGASSLSPRTIPSAQRPAGHGHRRGGSEFVGGRLREGNSIAVMTGSPTKEDGFPIPSLQPPRRGHRRGLSGAVSTNELPLLPLPQYSFPMKGSSAPNSPTHFERMEPASARPITPKAPEEETPSPTIPEPSECVPAPVEPAAEEQPSVTSSPKRAKPGPRARVGFSDTLEFIPRPLSLVSTDTSSTITAKPSHAVSGSISSLVSASPPNVSDGLAPMSRTVSRDTVDSRPSTAGAILERIPHQNAQGPNTSPRRRNSIPALLDVTEMTPSDSPVSSPSRASKRWTFFGLESLAGSSSPTKTRPVSAGSSESATRVASAGSSSDQASDSHDEAMDIKSARHGGGSKKPKKHRKKMKGWAGSILQRKPKNQSDKASKDHRPPTPTASVVPPDEEDDEEIQIILDQPVVTTPTVVIDESPPLPQEEAPSPRRPMEDMSLSMIDLDAALGPFNTPLPHNPEWEAAQRAAGNTGKRRMHSAQGMRGFSGPGMHYHRRAESAPDLPPFDPGSSSIHRFGSSSTMADVFEEDEEDDNNGGRAKLEFAVDSSDASTESDGDVTPPAVTPVDAIMDRQERTVQHKKSGLSDKDQSSVKSIHAERSKTSLHDSVITEEPQSLRFRNAFPPRPASSGSPRLSSRKASWATEPSPVDIGPAVTTNIAISPYSNSHASSFPSPSPRSPISADTQRLSTAPSSVNEDNSFRSLLMGEPGPEVRLSVDYDIPSLTSSNSTTTRDSTFSPYMRMSQPTLREPRPLSVSSAGYSRRRSSLVSLSRLISSSHGEKSKLSMEVKLDHDAEAKKSRDSKTRRLGRLVQFWKPNKGSSAS
jgi:hypothetical protein